MSPVPEARPAADTARQVDLALLALGGLGLVRLLLAIAHYAVVWATSLQGDLDPVTSRATLGLWRAVTDRGMQLVDVGTLFALLVLARAPELRLDRLLGALAAASYATAAFIAVRAPGDVPSALALVAGLGPLPLSLWLLRDALRLGRPGLAVAASALSLTALASVALPFFTATLGTDSTLFTLVRLTTTWTVGRHLLFGLLAAVPLVLVLRRRAARRPADPVVPLPHPGWHATAHGLATLRQALVAKALVVGLTLVWATVVGASPSLPGPGMISATGAALAVGSLWMLTGARRWLAAPGRSAVHWAFTGALVAALACELAIAWLGSGAGLGANDSADLRPLASALVTAVGANAVAAILLVMALHRLARSLGLQGPTRTLARVSVLGLVALLIPWAAWLGRGLDALLDPWAISAVLVAIVGLIADLTVLCLVMDDLERRVRRGREAAGVAARFS